MSSFLVFGLAGAIGLAAAKLMSGEARLVVACGVLSVALLCDVYSLKTKTWCPVTLRRQTPKNIVLMHGERRAAVAWGLDAGLVFTTYRTSSISWALLALGLLGASPWWAGLGYSAGFLVPLVLGCSLAPAWDRGADATAFAKILVRRPSIARATCVAVLALAVLVTASALA